MIPFIIAILFSVAFILACVYAAKAKAHSEKGEL
jgi:hypothetical protein